MSMSTLLEIIQLTQQPSAETGRDAEGNLTAGSHIVTWKLPQVQSWRVSKRGIIFCFHLEGDKDLVEVEFETSEPLAIEVSHSRISRRSVALSRKNMPHSPTLCVSHLRTAYDDVNRAQADGYAQHSWHSRRE